MTTILISGARIEERNGEWWVMHPSNDAALAICSTEAEAERVRYDISHMSFRLTACDHDTAYYAAGLVEAKQCAKCRRIFL